MAKKQVGNDYEENIAALEKIVSQLESGELSLEESLALFEKGSKIYGHCTQMLDQAQARMDVLIESSGFLERKPYDMATVQETFSIEEEEE